MKRHSSFWLQQLEAHPDDVTWLLEDASLTQARSVERLAAEWRSVGWESLPLSGTFSALRQVKRREMLRITVRDLTGCAPLEETVVELSALADFCLQNALASAMKEMAGRHGRPCAQFAIFGMGKLGGQELNYSSDIDLIFVYSEEGVIGRLTHHDYFTRIAEMIVAGMRSNGQGGSLFRVDLRLRPEGNAGPITRSLESYENYYAAFGEVWERMALQKARLVAGDEELGYEFLQHLQPFCFPRHLPPAALEEIHQIKSRIETEVLKEDTLERHVKLGKGGIREIEFAVQALQLLHGARQVFSQEKGTLKSLQALQRLELLRPDDAAALTRAYVFLRSLEHRLQMREDRQTHLVPEDRATQTALAKGLGFKNHAAFAIEWKTHLEFVRSFFHSIVQPKDEDSARPTIPDWETPTPERDALLNGAGFQDSGRAAATLRTLSRGPDYAHVSQRTRGLFAQLSPHILTISRCLARPDFALQQFERFIEAYGSRAALYELLTSNPKTLELLFQLFDHSRYLTDILVRQPSLLEAIAFEGLLSSVRSRREVEAALAAETSERPETRLRSFQQAELLRIELRDILGLAASLEETWSEITLLADVCLEEAVRIACRSEPGRQAVLSETSLSPRDRKRNRPKPGGASPGGFCVIALGKYGGRDLSYGSDLDVIFVGSNPEHGARVIAAMTQDLGEGIVFKMDARLRPDGADGPLVLPLNAFAVYYEKRAQFWERQSLTRARLAAGDPEIGAAFLKMVDRIIYSRGLAGDELYELIAMRMRIENERGDLHNPARDFKTGAGGLVDVEFLAQAQQLLHGYKHKSLRRASTLETLRAMPDIAGWTPEETRLLIGDYLWLRRLESVLRRFHNAPVSQLPVSSEERAVAARHLGLESVGALETELMQRRNRIRETATRLMPTWQPASQPPSS
ncbi:MAG: bifunctional [glutamate--ammonia ligase]-adenylyl-L-tyrosine phosphorylase/[glutamate--ammonia-ligase] adenylyltransferase [Verrucomicrobia bacterium]|nr:bifunctional [glutamate--ammonia ligase]-adenylyl-L-tyrosine phosphorylase/[glutamate--ammonia-ligase] adenylyltransferase [Verrucomicrobiota bacterium]